MPRALAAACTSEILLLRDNRCAGNGVGDEGTAAAVEPLCVDPGGGGGRAGGGREGLRAAGDFGGGGGAGGAGVAGGGGAGLAVGFGAVQIPHAAEADSFSNPQTSQFHTPAAKEEEEEEEEEAQCEIKKNTGRSGTDD